MLPGVGERVAIGVAGRGREGDGRARGHRVRGGGEREGGGVVAWERTEIDDVIHVLGRGAAHRQRGDVNAAFKIGEGAAYGDRRVILAEWRAGGCVDELDVAAAACGEVPSQDQPFVRPRPRGVARVELAKFTPVSAGGILDDFHRIGLGGFQAGLIEGIEPVLAALGDGLDVVVWQPFDLVLGLRVVLVRGHAAAAHDIEHVAVLRVRSRADGTGAGGVPEIRVRQPEGVADFVGDDADRVTVYPHAAAAAPAAGGPGAAIETQHHAIVVVRIKSDFPRLVPGMGLFKTEAINITAIRGVLLHVPSFVARKLDRRCDGGERGEPAVRRLGVVIAHVAHDVVALLLRGRHRVLILEGERDVQDLQGAERRRGRGGQQAGEGGGTARAAFGLDDGLVVNGGVRAVAEVNDFAIGLHGRGGFRDRLVVYRRRRSQA